MSYPAGYRYTKEHEWIEVAGTIGTVGITDYAQNSLGDIVFVELPKVGQQIEAGATFGSVESVLLALDEIYHLNHRGQVGHYIARKLGDDCVEVRCETPYPRQFERGLIEGITRHAVLAKGSKYSAQFIDGQPGADRTCTLVIRQRR